jgi:hypothetical protein
MSILEEFVRKAVIAKAAADEIVIRRLLEQWVSGLEPAVACQDGRIIGLTLADAETGSQPPIVVRS